MRLRPMLGPKPGPMPVRVVVGRPFLFASAAFGTLCWLALGMAGLSPLVRALCAWDLGGACLLAAYAVLFCRRGSERIEHDAERQQAGEWAIFWVALGAAGASLAAVLGAFSSLKGSPPEIRDLLVALVCATLLVSWLVTHVLFAIRYAHEYYDRAPGADSVAGGLEFPGERDPDYWDFVYFALVLGMTFQVSDVQVTSHRLRRLALAHGMLGFGFNTVILALTVNLAAGLL